MVKKSGFTIVELLVVIVVIGVLAAITVVSYTGISQKAIIASLQSDLSNASKRLKMYQVEHGQYPTSLDSNYCPNPSDAKYCLKVSSGNSFDIYSYNSSVNNSTNPQTFTLKATNGSKYYSISNDSGPTVAASSYTILTDNLIHHYDAARATGTAPHTNTDADKATWYDLVGSRNLTLNGPSWTTASGWSGSPYSYALTAATNDYASNQTSWGQGLPNYTLEVWCYLPSNPANYKVIATMVGTGGGYVIYTHSGKIKNITYGSGSPWNNYAISSVLTEGWKHIVVVGSTGSSVAGAMYINGALNSTIDSTSVLGSPNGTTPLGVGGIYNATTGYTGDGIKIAQMRIYSDQLTAQEALSNFNSTKSIFGL